MYIVQYLYKGERGQAECLGTEKEIRERLSREGKVVLSMKQPFVLFTHNVRKEEVIAVFTALGDLLEAGIPLSRALDSVIVSLNKKSRMPSILMQIRSAVVEGRSLSQAMDEYRPLFGATIISMVTAGESAGKLGGTLVTAAEHIRHMMEIRGEMLKKLTYPAVVFIFGIGALFINTTFVIPKILNSELFKGNASGKGGNDGAVFIKILQGLSDTVPWILGSIFLLVILFIIFFKQYQEEAEKIIVKIPIIREFIFYRSYFVAFSSLSNLLAVGVRLDVAMGIVADSQTLFTVKREFEESRRALKEGALFTRGLKSLSAIEKTMLDTAQSMDRVQRNFSLIADRYYRMYLQKVRSIGPKIYTMVIFMVFGIFILMLLGIMLPYFKVIGGIK